MAVVSEYEGEDREMVRTVEEDVKGEDGTRNYVERDAEVNSN